MFLSWCLIHDVVHVGHQIVRWGSYILTSRGGTSVWRFDEVIILCMLSGFVHFECPEVLSWMTTGCSVSVSEGAKFSRLEEFEIVFCVCGGPQNIRHLRIDICLFVGRLYLLPPFASSPWATKCRFLGSMIFILC